MKDMQKLRELFFSGKQKLMKPPHTRQFHGEWAEVVVAIGKDHTAYISMPEDALAELVKLTDTPNDVVKEES